MLQACLNGGRRAPGVPSSPSELAKDALAALQHGAACFHIHPRLENGEETLAPEAVGAALSAIRKATPGVAVGIGSGTWIKPGGRARHADVEKWDILPDYVSVNFNEDDAPDLIKLLSKKEIEYEAGIWTVADCERYLAHGLYNNCTRILIEMNDETDAISVADQILGMLQEAKNEKPILLHGMDESTWPCLKHAAQLGLDSRIGFEDTMLLPDGSRGTNETLVLAAMTIFKQAQT